MYLLATFAYMQVALAQKMPFETKRFVDSLEDALAHHPSDSLKARAAYHLAEFWAKQDTNKARPYLEKGRKLAGNSVYMQASYQYYVGKFYLSTDSAKSEFAFLKADSILAVNRLTFKNAYTLRAAIWYNYGVLRQLKDDTEGVIKIFLEKVIPYTRLAGLQNELPRMYLAVGQLFDNELDYERAGLYFDQSLAMLDTVDVEPELQANIYSAAVGNLLSREKFAEARKYQNQVKELLQNYRETPYYLAYLLNETAYFIKQKLYDDALLVINQGIALSTRLDDSLQRESFLHEKFKVLYSLGQYREAKDILVGLAESPVTPFMGTKMIFYQNLSEVYEKLGDFEQAYRWLKPYSTIADSLNQARLKEKIVQLEAKFQNAESRHEIASLKAQKSEAELEAKNSRLFAWVLGLSCFVLLLVATFSIIYYREQKQLGKQMAINHQQQVKELEQHQQLAVTKAILEGEERERQRVARDLHDGLGGMLAGVKINLSGWAANNLEAPQHNSFYKVISQLDSSVTELRRIARNMMPEALFKFGLETALRDQCEFYTTAGIHIDFQPFELSNTNSLAFQITVYRIVQELLSNAVRHGKATNIVVQCSQSGSDFLIAVEDNGMGFDKTIGKQKNGIGLSNIKSRVSYYKGEMELITSPGEGTTVHIELHDHEEGYYPDRIGG